MCLGAVGGNIKLCNDKVYKPTIYKVNILYLFHPKHPSQLVT